MRTARPIPSDPKGGRSLRERCCDVCGYRNVTDYKPCPRCIKDRVLSDPQRKEKRAECGRMLSVRTCTVCGQEFFCADFYDHWREHYPGS